MSKDGSGYLQDGFSTRCGTDAACPLITKEALCARKLAENLCRLGRGPDSFLPYAHLLSYIQMDVLTLRRQRYVFYKQPNHKPHR